MRRCNHGATRFITGACLVWVGLLAVLSSQRIFPEFDPLDLWPTVLMVWGAREMVRSESVRCFVWGGGLFVFGVLLTLDSIGWIHMSWAIVWALVLIAAGIRMMVPRSAVIRQSGMTVDQTWSHSSSGMGGGLTPWQTSLDHSSGGAFDRDDSTFWQPNGAAAMRSTSDSVLQVRAMMSQLELRNDCPQFQGGRVQAALSEVTIDLVGARIETAASIRVEAFFAGLSIRVPSLWAVDTSRVHPIAGVVTNRNLPASGEGPRLILTGNVLAGRIEVIHAQA